MGKRRGCASLGPARDKRGKRARAVWSEALGERFLALVRETGNGAAAARALGAPHLFNNRMRRDGDLRRRYREALKASGRARSVERRASKLWSPALGSAFLALVRETGNARAAAAALGAPNAFNNKMKRDPAFRARVRAAAADADARLAGAGSAFPGVESVGVPGGAGSGTRASTCPTGLGTRTSTCPLGSGEDLGGYLKPGRKRRQARPQPVIRRNSSGRWQVTMAREGHWTAEIEADFLARLAASGNFNASARAVGFQPASVHERVRKWAAFKAACDEALEAADVRLGYQLVAAASAMLRVPGEPRPDGEPEVPFDPDGAMRILGFLDGRKNGGSRRGPRKGPPDRTFEEAMASVLAKIEAIERHEALLAKEQGEISHQSGTLMGAQGGEEGR
jgi:hypothetical protein